MTTLLYMYSRVCMNEKCIIVYLIFNTCAKLKAFFRDCLLCTLGLKYVKLILYKGQNTSNTHRQVEEQGLKL